MKNFSLKKISIKRNFHFLTKKMMMMTTVKKTNSANAANAANSAAVMAGLTARSWESDILII